MVLVGRVEGLLQAMAQRNTLARSHLMVAVNITILSSLQIQHLQSMPLPPIKHTTATAMATMVILVASKAELNSNSHKGHTNHNAGGRVSTILPRALLLAREGTGSFDSQFVSDFKDLDWVFVLVCASLDEL